MTSLDTEPGNTQSGRALRGERVAFVGKLAGMARRDAQKLVRDEGGVCVEQPDAATTLVVVSERDLPLGDFSEADGPLDAATRQAADEGRLRIISETELWQRLGLVESETEVRRLYTPAMLADLLGVSVSVIRRWRRKGLIVPAREVRKLPYFDFQEIATARRLAELLAAGCTPQAIEKKLAELARFLPSVERPLAQLSVIVEGKQLLLRQGDGLIEPGGQLRFDFEAEPDRLVLASDWQDAVARMLADDAPGDQDPASPDAMLAAAMELEDHGQLTEAAEMYRALLVATGPNAETNFALAELLYRMGELSAARERYYVAIEIDEDYVEARANLGCVLAEMGQHDLAEAAFRGALHYHNEYPDVLYHLARTLDALGRPEEAEIHWRIFLTLAPDSPWADQARTRLDAE